MTNPSSQTSAESIDHDRNFKELISTFFLEFLELFLPELAATIEPNSIKFLQQEYFADLVEGNEKIIDLLVEVRQSGLEKAFIFHIEAQSYNESKIARRMFYYFARLHQFHVKDIYPIVVFSYDKPYRAEQNSFTVEFPNLKVLEFRFHAIQLNRLDWRDFINRSNPVAAALMSKMKIAKKDRPKVKVECLRLLVTLKLDPAKTRLISKFVDTYLRLNAQEEKSFQAEIDKIESAQREAIMQVTTSWEEKGIQKGIEQGIERGIEQGIERGQRSLVVMLLEQKLGKLPEVTNNRISDLATEKLSLLAIALLNFQFLDDLHGWLDTNG